MATSMAAVCPGCGYDAAASRSPLLLPVLTRLNQRYLVGRTLGKPGGFGVTYLGFDVTLRVKVAIKEYCPRELVGRDVSRKTLVPHSQEDGEIFRFGLQAFLDEARTLARFDHANVVRVRDFFEANGTAYLVMDYYEGESLLEYLARHSGILPWRATLDLMLPVLDGLREVHRHGFLHRDIKPHNIYLTTQGRPILLDFGSARQAMGERSRSLSVVLTEGYAPFEQYHSRGQQGPWTDIYGAAATIYLLLTGQTPPPAPERIRGDGLIPPRQLIPDLPPPLNAALINGLAMDVQQRPQTMEQFEEWLHVVAEGKASPPIAPVESQPSVKPKVDVPAEPELVQSIYRKKNFVFLAVFSGLIGFFLLFTQINHKPSQAEIQQWINNGNAYYSGHGVSQDYNEAVRWYRKAADQGIAYAQYALGVSYAKGQGIPQSYIEAIRWFRKAADQGDARSQCDLGISYASGFGVPQNDVEAVNWYRKAADQGDAFAQFNLGNMYLNGRGVPQNDIEAANWYRKAADQGDTNAQFQLGWIYDNGKGVPKNDVEAVNWYRKAADQGDADAQFNLGNMHLNGRGVPKNDVEAVNWYRKAADQGNASAQYAVAVMYGNGKGVPQNDVEAARWCRKAADQGGVLAQTYLGNMYLNGRGVLQNDVEAVNWYRKAADQGNTDAQVSLGWMYENGRGVPKNDIEAVNWYRKAADQGNALAQVNLGWMYNNGKGVQQNDVEAVNWYRKSADQGNARAQTNLGFIYLMGRGVPKNDVEAVRWHRLAADQGNAVAQFNLGEVYEKGLGIPHDIPVAVYWYRKAAEQGFSEAQKALKRLGYK